MDQATLAPIRRTITVRRGVEDSFRIFTFGIGEWWELDKHAISERAVTAVIEPREGGRVFERWDDGSEHTWGEVLAWEPPSRLVLAWKPNSNELPPTEIEVTFKASGDGGTLVELEHRGWERLGEIAEEARKGYGSAGGWGATLAAFVRRAERNPR